MAVEQKTVRLHDPVDPLDVHGRTAPFAALTPEQRMDAPITVGRLTGDQRLDLGDKLGLRVWATTSPPPAPLACRVHGQIGAGDAQGIGDGLHGVPSRAGDQRLRQVTIWSAKRTRCRTRPPFMRHTWPSLKPR